jgi:hypothetical protein
MIKAKTKAELAQLTRPRFITPLAKDAMLVGVQEEIAKIKREHGHCEHAVRCCVPQTDLPRIPITAQPIKGRR